MHKLVLTKPDGRLLILYSSHLISRDIQPVSPTAGRIVQNPYFRWHPLRGEWVDYASYRQDRTFLPPAEYNPLAPTKDPAHPTELPQGDYDVAVFENLFPSLMATAENPPRFFVDTLPAKGTCEVVVFTQDPSTSLGALPLRQIDLVLQVWTDRYREIGSRDSIQYVMPFENRGVEVGVTLHHPHGQIYAYPFIPPIVERELQQQQIYFEKNGRTLIQDHVQAELQDGDRILYAGRSVAAFVPVCARYPYEVWIAPVSARSSLTELNEEERVDFARALKTVLLKYDGLWKRPFPYVMVFHQAPTDGREHPESHFHVEFYPPHRSEKKLKYLAGTEIGAGMFISDTLPEEKAAELQNVKVHLED
jgi:UDPglucose--hexose-1-phosphate uridylyltransferase